MSKGLTGRAGLLAEQGASALFGAALGYAAYAGLSPAMPEPQLGALAAAVGTAAWMACGRIVHRVAERPNSALAPFQLREFDPFFDDELVLTDADRLDTELILTDADRLDSTEPLELDDILAEIGPQSRVVRLFDRKAMPTPGQLGEQIGKHLEAAAPSRAPDDSQALSDALTELRRSLR